MRNLYETELAEFGSSPEKLGVRDPVGAQFLVVYTPGGAEVTLNAAEAGRLAAFIINKFPLDALGGV